jgi:uncharacterized metal-binding protein YceD (DUF177 family)
MHAEARLKNTRDGQQLWKFRIPNFVFLHPIVGKSRKVTIFASPKKTQTVKPLKEFHIPFLGLKVGTHHYQFNLTDAFFDAFEYSEITTANIDVEVQLEKQSTLLVLDFELSGSVELMCDRCGDAFQQPLQSKERLIVKFGDETSSTDEEILILGPSENTVDIEQYLYEYAHLALPARHVHETEEECNQEVLAAYKKYSVESDERDEWAALKNLHFEDNEPFEDEEEE